MQKKTLLPQIAAPVQRPQIANSSVQGDNQAAVQPIDVSDKFLSPWAS